MLDTEILHRMICGKCGNCGKVRAILLMRGAARQQRPVLCLPSIVADSIRGLPPLNTLFASLASPHSSPLRGIFCAILPT